MKTIERLLNELTWFDIGMTVVLSTALYLLFFGNWTDPNPYNTCIMKAIDRLESSADILSLCKELK